MPLKGVVDSIEEVPEAIRDNYVEQDGKFVLQVEDMDLNSNWEGLKTSYNNIKTEKKEIEKMLKRYKAYGSPDEIESMLEEYNTLKQNPGVEDVDKVVQERLESLKSQLVKQHQSEYEKLKSEYDQLSQRFRDNTLQNAAMMAINKTRGFAKALMPILKSVMDIDEEGNVFVRGEDGNPLLDNKGEYLKVADYLEKLKNDDEFRGLFAGSAANGSGVVGGGGSTGIRIIRRTDPNFAELAIKYARELSEGKAKIVS